MPNLALLPRTTYRYYTLSADLDTIAATPLGELPYAVVKYMN